VLAAIEAGLVVSCHDFAEGGMLIAAIESLIHEEGPTGRGATLDLSALPLPPIEALLTESGGFLIEVAPENEGEFERLLGGHGARSQRIGKVIDSPRLEVSSRGRRIFDEAVAPLAAGWSRSLGPWIEGETA
jgi:phosphoribosylformylglycinamidine synthase